MREASGGRKVTHQVARAQTEESFAAPVELVDHVELREDAL